MAPILIVAADRLIASALQRQLTRLGHTVLRPATSAAVALAAVRVFQPEAVFMDSHLPGGQDGLTVGGMVEAVGTPVIYLSTDSRAQLTADYQGTMPRCHLEKPLAREAMVRTLEWALQYGTLQRTLQALRQQVAEHRKQVTVLQARVKEFVQQVHELRELITGRGTANDEEASA